MKLLIAAPSSDAGDLFGRLSQQIQHGANL
jgi:hypothetical protein